MDFSKIIEACGELARGFKKLKAELSKHSATLETKKKGELVPIMVALDPKSESEDEKVQENMIPDLDDALFWIGSTCCWGVRHARDLAKFMVGKRWRGDRFRNLWRLRRFNLAPEVSQNWTPAPDADFDRLYEAYISMTSDTYDALVEAQRDNLPLWQEIRSSRLRRFHHIREATITPLDKKEFRRILVENHRSLPALRGRN